MRYAHSEFRRHPLAMVTFLCLFWGLIALSSGQGKAQPPEDEQENAEELDVGIRANFGVPRMTRQNLRESLFGSFGGSEAAFQKMKRESIRREVDRVDKICELTQEQLSKVNDAIELDIQHMRSNIESILASYDDKMQPEEQQQIYMAAFQYVSKLQTEKLDSIGIWYKVLKSQLTKEQVRKLDSDKNLVAENRKRTAQLRQLLSLQRKLGLSAAQRVKVNAWLGQEKIRDLDFPALCKAAAVADELAGVLSENQLKSLREPLAQVINVQPQALGVDFFNQ